GGRLPSISPLPAPAPGCAGSMCRWLSAGMEIVRTVSAAGRRRRRGASSASASAGEPRGVTSITTKSRPRPRSGTSGGGGEGRGPEHRGELVWQPAGRQLLPCRQDLAGRVDRPPQEPGVHTGDREEPELERGDHAETAATAAQRPEQVRLADRVDAAEPA